MRRGGRALALIAVLAGLALAQPAQGAFQVDGIFGSSGTGDGQFRYVSGVAVAPDGSVYVADINGFRVQRFTADGTFMSKWGGTFGSANGQFRSAQGVAVDGAGNVF